MKLQGDSTHFIIEAETWIQGRGSWSAMIIDKDNHRKKLADAIEDELRTRKMVKVVMNEKSYQQAQQYRKGSTSDLAVVNSHRDNNSWSVRGTVKELLDQQLTRKIRVTVELI